MSEEIPGIQQETETQKIDSGCKNLLIICNSLLDNYGKKKNIELSDNVNTFIGLMFRRIPKELPAINMTIYFDTKWQEIQIIGKKNRVDIVLGDPAKERLVLGQKDSWIQLPKPPYRDIHDPGIPPPSIRQVTPDDLQRYEQAIDITRRDLIHDPQANSIY